METMKPKADRKPNELPLEGGVSLYEIRFCRQGGRDIPLRTENVAGGISVIRKTKAISLTWYPRVHQVLLVEQSRDPEIGTQRWLIPDGWCAMSPDDGQRW